MDGDESVLDFGGSVTSRQSNCNSHRDESSSYSRSSTKAPSKGKLKYCGTTTMGLPFVMDPWKTTEPQKIIGLQIQMLSGENHTVNTSVRVSTDQRSLVIKTPLSDFATDPKVAFDYVIEERKNKAIENGKSLSKNEIDMMAMVLNVHSKTIARKSSVKALRNTTLV